MAMSTEDAQEYREAVSLLSADELRAQLGDDAETDTIINEILANGKAVEMKVKPDLEDDDTHPNPDDKRVDPKPKAGQDDDDDEEEEEEEEDPAAGAAAAANAGASSADAAAAAAAAAAGDQGAGDIAPLDLKFLDTEFKNRQAALDTQNQKDFKAMMDGEIEPEEYAARNTKYMNDRDGLRDEKVAHASYYTDVHGAKQAALKDGINYDKDPEKGAAWDEWVKRIAGNPANAAMSDSEILAAAHKKVMVEFDLKPGAGSAAGTKAAQNSGKNVADGKKVAEKQGRAPKLDNIPPTLGGIPAAATSDGQDGGEFAHLENLSGMAYERAIAAMSPDQRERYGMM